METHCYQLFGTEISARKKGTHVETEKVPKAKSTIWGSKNFIDFL